MKLILIDIAISHKQAKIHITLRGPCSGDTMMEKFKYILTHVAFPFIFYQHDAVNNLRKAKNMYITRQVEYEKSRESSLRAEHENLSASTGATQGKLERKRKLEEDAMHKVPAHIRHMSALLLHKLFQRVFKLRHVLASGKDEMKKQQFQYQRINFPKLLHLIQYCCMIT